MNYQRTAEDALEVIGHAKHSRDDVFPVTQVFYHPSVEECQSVADSMRLMDVDDNFIQKLEEGERFIFRGSGDDKLVLCTENETYEVKEGEISNALVFIPGLSYLPEVKSQSASDHAVADKKIAGILSSYLELRPTFPRLCKLRELLNAVSYKGPDEVDEDCDKGYYLCDLLDLIQSSRTELIAGLKDISACCIDGRWRLLDVEYESRVLSYIINLAEEKSWSVIPKTTSCRVLQSVVPDSILDHVFEHFTLPCRDDDDDVRTWIPKKLCRSFGEMLLRAGEGKFRYNEFMMAWKQCLPRGIEPDLTSLRGLALMEQEGTQQQVIHLFPEYSLSENISERFRLLFKRKEKWTLQEIEPYIEKLATKGMNVSTMLTKFSRPSTLNGVRVFGARHLK